ncbi:MAG: hypothetical protein ACRCV0_01395 [Brevinema sp.]
MAISFPGIFHIFWEEVIDIIQNIISRQIILDPKLFLLGLNPEKHNYTKNERTFIDLGLLKSQKMYSFILEKKTSRPKGTLWLRQMLSALPLERITYVLKRQTGTF